MKHQTTLNGATKGFNTQMLKNTSMYKAFSQSNLDVGIMSSNDLHFSPPHTNI